MALINFFKERLSLLLAVLFPVYMFFLHAPFEMYLTNRLDFWFGLSDFWWMILIAFTAAFVILFLAGAFLPKLIRNIYSVIGIACGLCLYLQGNFLNTDLGSLNGSEIIWSDYSVKFIINAIIWLAIISVALLLFFIFKQKTVKIISAIAAFILLIQTITLSTLFISGVSAESNATETSQYTVTDRNLYTVSKDENVIIMILDMFDNEYMREIINETPEVKETFKDFTFFDNAVGSYSTTAYAVGTILTGDVIGNTEYGLKENVDKAYENTKLFNELREENYVFDMYTIEGMTPQKVLEMSENYETAKSVISDEFSFIKRMYRLVICRFAPDLLKQRFWLNGTEFAELRAIKNPDHQPFSDDTYKFYQGLQNDGISLSDEKRFKVIHLNAVHFPYLIDADANPIEPTSDKNQAVDTARGTLKIVDAYLDAIKEQGAYDNSTIILLADHGYYDPGVLTNPLIMVKKANTSCDFTVSNAPVSHYDIHATIMDSLNLNTNDKYGKSMFNIEEGEQRDRIFYQYNLNESHEAFKFRLVEWTVDSEGNARKYFKLTGKEIKIDSTVVNHFESCEYCIKNGTEPVDAPNSASILH